MAHPADAQGASDSPAPPPPPPDPPPFPTRPDAPAKVEPPKLALPQPAGPAKPEGEGDYTTNRYEPAGLPLLGGSTDIGFQFGVVGTLSHFADGIKPYAWNMDVVLSASLKDGPQGVQFVQESLLWNADFAGFMDGKLRFNPQVQYQRTINMGYYGLGNAASGVVPQNYTGPSGRYFEWLDSVGSAYIQPRYVFSKPWYVTGAAGFRFVDASAYADSKLARDAIATNANGDPVIRGLRPLSLGQIAFGTGFDSRDNEVFARSGGIGQIGIAYQQGVPVDADVEYGETQALIQGYKSLGPLVLAGRFVADFQFGNVPFYDLAASGPFAQSEAIGGGSAIRGVPIGRYSGEIKTYANVELRSLFTSFHVIGHKVTLGADALFDTGRSWNDYSFKSPLDGNGLGLKYGVGGGIYCIWGQAAIFRVDAAYSPDAAAENPSFPVGIYVADGTSF